MTALTSTPTLIMGGITTMDMVTDTTGRFLDIVSRSNLIHDFRNDHGTRVSDGRPYESRFDYEKGTREDTYLE